MIRQAYVPKTQHYRGVVKTYGHMFLMKARFGGDDRQRGLVAQLILSEIQNIEDEERNQVPDR